MVFINNFLNHQYLPFLVLIILGLITRFLFIWYPAEVVFDEVHFGKFVSAYYTGEYYFDIHPPLGKLLIAGFVKFFGFRSDFDFEKIGESYGSLPYVALRFLPALAGSLLPVVIFGWLLTMGLSRPTAFLAGMFILLDNANLVQSRFILVDSFLMLFGFSGLWLFFLSRSSGYKGLGLVIASIFLGLSISIKWTGLGFLALAVLIFLYDHLRSIKLGLVRLIILISTVFLVYAASFQIHFLLLPKSGSGDLFMSEKFRSTLWGSPYYNREDLEKPNFLEKFLELNRVMYLSNARLSAEHSYSSKWYTWPLMLRPVYYWVEDFGAMASRIYFLGNPVVWWFSTIGFGMAIFFWKPKRIFIKYWLYAGWIINFLPFAKISRVLFLYHYLIPLVFSVAIFSGWLGGEGLAKGDRRVWWLVLMVLGLAVAGFLFFAPLSYGLPLSDFGYKIRIWLSTWV